MCMCVCMCIRTRCAYLHVCVNVPGVCRCVMCVGVRMCTCVCMYVCTYQVWQSSAASSYSDQLHYPPLEKS